MPENGVDGQLEEQAAETRRMSPAKNLFRKMFDMKSTQQRPQGEPLPTPLEIRSSEHDSTPSSPISPEFDSITSLPTPLLGEVGFSPSAQALSPGFASHGTPSRKGAKKSYGPLTTRPSVLEHQMGVSASNRVVSEYGSKNSIDRYSNASKAGLLDSRAQGSHRSPYKRTVSTPLVEGPEGLEREDPGENYDSNSTASVSRDVVYRGVDNDGNAHSWRKLKQLGRGTFSVVVLGECIDQRVAPIMQKVAIKIVELPTQRETRTRVESSLRRELEVLKSLSHPSIIKLLALSAQDDKYCIITPLCPGGDLFELAAQHRNDLKPQTIRRIFAETACAVAYLHKNNIVHRDIKLENILVNIPFELLVSLDHFDLTPIITLTDFGLSRTIDPANPLLTTRCGSEDYVPPELLIGLPYDGRQSDSWALGVVLYAIMESRLPFDPPPTKSIRARSRVAHRIARIEWAWSTFDDENMGFSWNEDDWSEAKWIVSNLLVRREKRITSEEVCRTKWVSDIIPESFKLI